MQYINTEILITEMGVSNEAKNFIPLKFLRIIKNKKFVSSYELNSATHCILTAIDITFRSTEQNFQDRKGLCLVKFLIS
jgi:hypothetical protein